MKQVKIINDTGVSLSTKVLNEDGTEIRMIESMDVSFRVDEVVKAKVTLMTPLMEVTADLEYEIFDLSRYPSRYLEELQAKIKEELEKR